MNRITSISDFEAPQANIALSEPFAVQLAADMAFLTHDALKELQEQTELFELVSFPAPYHVKLLLVEGSAQLDITDARQRTIACKAAMSDLKSTIENYVKAVQKTEFCSRMSDIASLMTQAYDQVTRFANTHQAPSGSRPQKAAVAVEDSVQPGYLVCLEDGKKMKMLKRYLRTHYGLSPEQYRKRWNLPATYPMVAPDYAQRRSALAKHIGLGHVGKAPKAPLPNRKDRMSQVAGQRRAV